MSKCICHAHEPNECICGAWDDVDYEEWYNEEDIHKDCAYEYNEEEQEEEIE